MEKKEFVIVTWPEIQDYMERDDFKEKENYLEKSIDTINACKEAHQGGSDFILCNLICLVSDLKQKGYDKKTLEELDKFIEGFK